MIKILSPYYINIPYLSPATGLVCSEFTLKLYVWNGLKTDIPIDASYEITKINPEGLTTSTKIDISNLISTFLEFEPKTVTDNEIINGDNQVWYSVSVFYTTENTSEILTPQLQETKLALKGYNYGMSGENAETPSDKILMQAREFKVARDSKVIIPIEIDEPIIPTPNIIITAVDLISGDDYNISFTSVGTYSIFYAIITPEVGDAVIVNVSGITSPQAVETTFTGIVGFQMFGYDTTSGTNVTSNTFNITI